MKTFIYPARSEWNKITERPHTDYLALKSSVNKILYDVRNGGDKAIIKFESEFDHVQLENLMISQAEIDEAPNLISKELYNAMVEAHRNIYTFHKSQQIELQIVETTHGVTCWQKCIPIENVGLYVPCGTAPLFSTVLMLATPAKIAGCKNIVMCTPPTLNGKVNPAILTAAKIAGVNKIFKAGGVQAIGGMAYGTESIPKVSKIFGPGNQYVMMAKQIVSLEHVAIDMPAGPSEVCVIADETSNAAFVAADLLSQAEHGIDSQVILITTSKDLLDNVKTEIGLQLKNLPRKAIAEKALDNSKLVLLNDIDTSIALSNMYAPEHLILSITHYDDYVNKIVNAGSVFLGKYSCESAGDYASGTNHTLPTNGYATAYSGVNLDSFNRKITFQHITKEGVINIGKTVETMAANEQLYAHKNAMTLRLNDVNGLINNKTD